MTDVNSMIKADAEKRIAEFVEMAQDAESKIKHLENVKAFAAQKIAEYGKVIANSEEQTHAVQWFNTDNLETRVFTEAVQVHGAGCEHIKMLKKSSKVKAGLVDISSVEEWGNTQDFFDDYNADFYAEGGDDACHSISFYPCTKMVSEVKTITEMSK